MVDRLTPHRTITSFERQLLTFFAQWVPYGQPPDDEVFVEFGMTPARLEIRVREIVSRNINRRLPAADVVLLVRVFKGLDRVRRAQSR